MTAPRTSTTRSRVASSLVALALLVAADASAQVLTPPTRSFRGLFAGGPPPDPNRTRQELTLSANLMGGYDDNLALSEIDAGAPPDPSQAVAGNLAVGEAILRYWRGRQLQGFEVEGRAYSTYYDTGPGTTTGGSVRVGLNRQVGRRSTFRIDQRVGYDPLYTLGAFGPLNGTVAAGSLPSDSPANGIFARNSWNNLSTVGFDHPLGQRHTVSLLYNFDLRRFDDDLGGDSRAHRASLSMTRELGRRASLRGSYSYADTSVTEILGFTRPVKEHVIEAGPQYTRRLSPTRQIMLSGGAGATRVSTLSSTTNESLDYWAPYGQASARIDIGRSWAVWSDYRRGVTVLDGLTTETFLTDSARVNLGGLIGPRVEAVVSGGLAEGRAHVGADSSSRYHTYSFATQLEVGINRNFAVVVNYNYFNYAFRDTPNLAEGFPPTFERNTIRFGLNIWLPLVGNYVDRTRGTAPAAPPEE